MRLSRALQLKRRRSIRDSLANSYLISFSFRELLRLPRDDRAVVRQHAASFCCAVPQPREKIPKTQRFFSGIFLSTARYRRWGEQILVIPSQVARISPREKGS